MNEAGKGVVDTTQGSAELNAEQLVALADRAAAQAFADPVTPLAATYGVTLYVLADGSLTSRARQYALCARLDDVTASSPRALKAALLTSAVESLTAEIVRVVPGWREKRIIRAELRDEIDALLACEAKLCEPNGFAHPYPNPYPKKDSR